MQILKNKDKAFEDCNIFEIYFIEKDEIPNNQINMGLDR